MDRQDYLDQIKTLRESTDQLKDALSSFKKVVSGSEREKKVLEGLIKELREQHNKSQSTIDNLNIQIYR